MIRWTPISGYIVRLILVPLTVTLAITIIVFLLEEMLRLFDFVLVSEGPVELVWKMLSQLLPQYLSHGISLGVFIGILLAFRKLSMSSELPALAASGVSLWNLMKPAYAVTLIAMAVNFILIAYLQPLSLYHYFKLGHEAVTDSLSARIKVGEFLQINDGLTLRIGRVMAEGEEFGDVFVENCNDADTCTVITADRGRLALDEDHTALSFYLADGRVTDARRTLDFGEYDFRVRVPAFEEFRKRGIDQREATIGELFSALNAGAPAAPEDRAGYVADLHWRILYTLTFLVMPLVAAVFGIADVRSSGYAKPIAGIIVLVGYNEILEAGQRWVATDGISPWLALWPTFAAFTALGLWALYRLAEHPGGGRSQIASLFGEIDRRFSRLFSGIRPRADRQRLISR